jgi:hypothetical protein
MSGNRAGGETCFHLGWDTDHPRLTRWLIPGVRPCTARFSGRADGARRPGRPVPAASSRKEYNMVKSTRSLSVLALLAGLLIGVPAAT